MRLFFALFPIIIFISGCISTNTMEIKNPQYNSFQISSVLVAVNNNSPFIRNSMENNFVGRMNNYNVSASAFNHIFPLGTKPTIEDIQREVKNRKIETYLSIEILDDDASTRYAGAINNANTNIYMYNNYAYGQTTGYSVPVYSSQRQTRARAILYNISDQIEIWVGDIIIEAGGTLYTKEEVILDHIIYELVHTLDNNRMILKK